jgi:hypothetical protein
MFKSFFGGKKSDKEVKGRNAPSNLKRHSSQPISSAQKNNVEDGDKDIRQKKGLYHLFGMLSSKKKKSEYSEAEQKEIMSSKNLNLVPASSLRKANSTGVSLVIFSCPLL